MFLSAASVLTAGVLSVTGPGGAVSEPGSAARHDTAGPGVPDRTPAPPAECLADMDDGSGTGRSDGAVTIDDLIYYLQLFTAGDPRASLTPAGGLSNLASVTVDDLLVYLSHYAAGC